MLLPKCDKRLQPRNAALEAEPEPPGQEIGLETLLLLRPAMAEAPGCRCRHADGYHAGLMAETGGGVN